MKLQIIGISSISHMTIHNGKPCDKYTATIYLHGVKTEYWVLTVFAKTKATLEIKIANLREKEYITIKDNRPDVMRLTGRPRQYW